MTPEARAARRDEVDAAAERAVAAATSCGAEALLVPGDLWDAENVPAATIHRLLEAFASFGRAPCTWRRGITILLDRAATTTWRSSPLSA